jgi:hypothetical protein
MNRCDDTVQLWNEHLISCVFFSVPNEEFRVALVIKILARFSNRLESIGLTPPYAQPFEIEWTSSHSLKRSLVSLGSVVVGRRLIMKTAV